MKQKKLNLCKMLLVSIKKYNFGFRKITKVDKTMSYYVLDYLLEDISEKVQAGLNDLLEKFPFYQ